MPADMDQEELIAQVVDLVVPLSNVEAEERPAFASSPASL